ncbi:MAG: hypothetical protein Q9191_004382 [Dirinaria sp. TL-2023a]
MAGRPSAETAPTSLLNTHSSREPELFRRRAPPPSLASLDNLNPYNKSTPTSIRSSPLAAPSSPSLLSPPVVNVPLSSPPPHLEGKDYLSTTPQAASHRTRQHKDQRQKPSFLQQRLGIGFDRAGGAEEKASVANGSDVKDDGTNSIDTAVSWNHQKPWPAIDTAELMIKRQATKSFLAPSTDPRSVEGDVTATSQTKNDDEQDSVATSSLRRLSQATKAFSVSKAQHIRRVSRAFTAAIRPPSVKEDGPSSKVADVVDQLIVPDISSEDVNAFLHRRQTRKPQGHYQASTQTATLGGGALDTPTTITLRKASDAYFVVIEPKGVKGHSILDAQSRPREPTVESQEPSVALMDFRSERRFEPRKSLWYSLPLLSDQSKPETSESVKCENVTVQADSPTPTPCLPSIQPRTLPTETAVTFSSVHPAAMNSPTKRRSRNTSVSSHQRRTSTVQIRSRSSVHQIIWVEDEKTTASSDSSRESISSIHTQNAGSVQLSGNVTSLQRSRSAPASPGYKVASHGPQHSHEENIFEWSWSAHPTSGADTDLRADPPPVSPVEQAPRQQSRRRPSVSKDSSVESFPPLLERKDTTEWRRAPLGDINDPMGGGTERWMPVIASTEECNDVDLDTPRLRDEEDMKAAKGIRNDRQLPGGIEQTDGTDQEGVEQGRDRKRRASSHPYAPARMGERGHIGSSLGASSHKRVSWKRL